MKSFNLKHSFAFFMAIALLAGNVAKAADIWTTDLEAAKTQAAAEKKDIVIMFTGSTWCPYCIKLNSKALATADFENEAPKDFIFVKVDFPQDLKTANPAYLKLAGQYGVQGFPTLILADEAGKAYGKTEYFAGINGKIYLDHLKLMKADAATARQKFTEGAAESDAMAKAKKYHEGIELLTDLGAPIVGLREQVKAIALADTAETLKYGGSASYRMIYVNIVSAEIAALARAGELAKAHAAFDLLFAEITLSAEEKQALLFGLKGRLYQMEMNAQKAIETFKQALDLAPSSKMAPEIKAYIEEMEKTQSDIIDVN